MDYLLIYLWTRLDALQIFFGVITFIVGLLLVIIFFMIIVGFDEDFGDREQQKNGVNCLKFIIPIFTIILFMFLAIPNKRDALIVYFIPKIAKSDVAIDTLDIVNKLPKVLQKQINEYLGEKAD